MSTLVGHALAATVASSAGAGGDQRAWWRITAFAILAAVLPDLDIVVFLTLEPLGMIPHRGISHSVLFAIASSSALTLIASRPPGLARKRIWVVLFAAALSHPALDYLMGAGPPVPFFAPFSERGLLSPLRLLPTAYYGRAAGAYFTTPFWTVNSVAALLEIVIFLPPVLAIRSKSVVTRALAPAIVLCGLALTLRLYR
jgi:inner membrane protein